MKKVFGYGLSMLLLAIASLIVIPAMIAASGESAWGSIALGQSIGAIGAAFVQYGWGFSGPAEIARGGPTERWLEFGESLKVRLALVLPTLVSCALIAVLLTRVRPDLAAMGAVSMGLTGLTANWYFVGTVQPYLFLVVETVPRVTGTLIAIAVMRQGADAFVGLAWQGLGILAAFVMSAAWILYRLRKAGAERRRIRSLWTLIRFHRHGLLSSVGSAGYAAAPLVIVTGVAHAVLPVYALADKFQRQVGIGLSPLITVLQGWVPRATRLAERAGVALLVSAGLAVLLGGGVGLVSPWLLGWLGGDAIRPSWLVTALVGVFVALNFYASVLARAVLASYGEMRAVSSAMVLSAIVGLPLVAIGAYFAGAEGALIGVNLGLLVRVGAQLLTASRCLRRDAEGGPGAGLEPEPGLG